VITGRQPPAGDRGTYSRAVGCAFVRLKSNASITAMQCVGATALASSSAGAGTGGGFSAYNSESVVLRDSAFRECASLSGGAVELDFSTVLLQNISFVRNSATQQGGALCGKARGGPPAAPPPGAPAGPWRPAGAQPHPPVMKRCSLARAPAGCVCSP
jgi:predicted outer membrane repeat protein